MEEEEEEAAAGVSEANIYDDSLSYGPTIFALVPFSPLRERCSVLLGLLKGNKWCLMLPSSIYIVREASYTHRAMKLSPVPRG